MVVLQVKTLVLVVNDLEFNLRIDEFDMELVSSYGSSGMVCDVDGADPKFT